MNTQIPNHNPPAFTDNDAVKADRQEQKEIRNRFKKSRLSAQPSHPGALITLSDREYKVSPRGYWIKTWDAREDGPRES